MFYLISWFPYFGPNPLLSDFLVPIFRPSSAPPRTMQLLLVGPRNAPTTLPDAATASSGATQGSCNAPGRCNCCFWGHAALQQRPWTLQLLLLGPRNAAATLQDAATAAYGATRRSCKAPRRRNGYFPRRRKPHPHPQCGKSSLPGGRTNKTNIHI